MKSRLCRNTCVCLSPRRQGSRENGPGPVRLSLAGGRPGEAGCGDASLPEGRSASVTGTLVRGCRGTRSRCQSAVQTSGPHREPASPFGAGEEPGAFEMHVVASVTPESVRTLLGPHWDAFSQCALLLAETLPRSPPPPHPGPFPFHSGSFLL